MSKRAFLVQNWILVSLLLLSLVFKEVEMLVPILIMLIIALKVIQGMLFVLKSFVKKFPVVFIILMSVALFSGALPFIWHISRDFILYGILFIELFVHGVDTFLQYRRGDKTWFINALITLFVAVFIVVTLIYDDGSIVISFFFEIIALSAIYYLFCYYTTGEMPGNYSLLNVNNAIFRDAFVPKRVYSEFMNASDEELPHVVAKYSYVYQERLATADEMMTVYMHTWQPGFDMMGHCDLSFRGVSYTLSNYDVENAYFNGIITTGTIGIGPMKEYINFSTDYKQKLIFGYTISLTKTQADAVAKELEKICQTMSEVWQPQNLLKNKAAYEIMTHISSFTIRKVIKGPFRNYFVLGTNCAKLVDVILNEAGIKTTASHNLLTPGEYMSLFDKDKHKRVVEKRVYWQTINHENVI